MKLFSFILVVVLLCFSLQTKGWSQLVYSGIERETITPIYSERQNTEWCWAANVQLIMNYYGAKVSQEDIIKRSFDVRDPYTSLPKWNEKLKAITSRLNGWHINYNNSKYLLHVNLVKGSPSPELLLKELKNDNPVILVDSISADSSRPIVCTAVGFLPGYYGPVIKELMVRDVMPGCADSSTSQRMKWKIPDVIKRISAYWLISVKKEKPSAKRHFKKE